MMAEFTDYERVAKRFMPALRLNAARMMVGKYGIKQSEAAAMLGITQAAISKYLNGSAGKHSDVVISKKSLEEFIGHMMAKREIDGQRVVCGMCQRNKKFDCSLMVK